MGRRKKQKKNLTREQSGWFLCISLNKNLYPSIRCHYIRCADIRCADIRCADIRCADIRCADIRCADIRCADIRCADIRCAYQFSSARFQLPYRRTC